MKLNKLANEDLRKWFGKGGAGSSSGGGWDRYNSKGEKVGKCGDSKEGSAYAACLSKEKAAKLGPDGRASFVNRKRAAQSKAGDSKKGNEKSKGQKPTFVKTGVSEGLDEKWSAEYKNSIDCNNPKGFSQKAHCAGKNENKSNNIDEAIHPEVYREFMQACKDAGLNSFQIFGMHVLAYILTLGATGVTILSALGIAQLAKDAKDTFNNWNAGRKLNPEKVKAIVKDFENKVNKLEGGRKKFFQSIINKMKKTNPENKSALVSINKDLDYYAKVYGIKTENMKLTVEQKMELFLEKNIPTDPAKWAASKAAAKRKFDVYPSAYANGWAAKNYKSKGGGWKTEK